MHTVELLAPAKDAETGIAAIDAGADAVYIGGPRFGARTNASGSVADIARLADYARLFKVRTYVTLNTLLKDAELEAAQALVREVWQAGADALIIQDMGLTELELPPIPLFASTQCHITTPEKARFLEQAGFRRLILARELSLDEIRAIRSATTVELECFIHGALCVCYSGQCYMSYAAGGRSGNRGDCAQPCRLNYDLTDETGAVLIADRNLLSLKDLNRTAGIGALLDAGVSSFKIEGRLKDLAYIRNVVSHYRQTIDRELDARGLRRSSSGRSSAPFTPNPAKSFNRGFTEYFLHGRPDPLESPLPQKAMGEPVGHIATVECDFFTLDSPATLVPGDGICFFDADGNLQGTNINRTVDNRFYPKDIPFIRPGIPLYRNRDSAFEKALASHPPQRKIGLDITFLQETEGFRLIARDEDGTPAEVRQDGPFDTAQNAERARDNIMTQLSKTGGTPYQAGTITVSGEAPRFVPLKVLNEARRMLLERLTLERLQRAVRNETCWETTDHPYPQTTLTFEGNALNDRARAFYRRHGVLAIEPAAESGIDMKGRRVMTSRYCLKRMLGLCERYPQEPLIPLATKPQGELTLTAGRQTYWLHFACDRCEMDVTHHNQRGVIS